MSTWFGSIRFRPVSPGKARDHEAVLRRHWPARRSQQERLCVALVRRMRGRMSATRVAVMRACRSAGSRSAWWLGPRICGDDVKPWLEVHLDLQAPAYHQGIRPFCQSPLHGSVESAARLTCAGNPQW